jgi:Protein of unknown function (DUF3108)
MIGRSCDDRQTACRNPGWHDKLAMMQMIRRTFLIAITLFALDLPARPAASEPVTLHYESRWAGLPAGDIDLQFEDRPGAYRSQIAIRTAGLPRWFTRFRGRAVSEGALSMLGLAAPGRYDATYDLRSRKDKRISLRFEHSGDVTVAERGAGDSSDKAPIDAADRTDVVDPLAALVRMREAIRTGLAQRGAFTIPVYDGKRRFDIVERSITRETMHIGGESKPVLHLDLALQPIAGFKDNDPEGNPDASSRAMHVFFSDDSQLIPLRLEVTIAWLTAVVEYQGRCGEPDAPCKPPFD